VNKYYGNFEIVTVNGRKVAVEIDHSMSTHEQLVRLCMRPLGPGVLVQVSDKEYAWGKLISDPAVTEKGAAP
jgi:hypothetical protein